MRVLVVDDLREVRAMVSRWVRTKTEAEVIGEAEDGATAVREARRLKPDVVILDLHMPVMGGLAAAKLIKENAPDTVIVVHTTGLSSEAADLLQEIGVEKIIDKGDQAGLVAALAGREVSRPP